MLALLTLDKLIKLEVLALKSLSYTAVDGCQWLDFTCRIAHYIRMNFDFFVQSDVGINPEMLCHQTFELDLPMPRISGLESIADVLTRCLDDSFPSYTQYLTAPNPNRLVKSSFALSLLWTAKFYHVIADSYRTMNDREYEAYSAYHASHQVLVRVLGLPFSGLFYDRQLPRTHDWLIS